MQTIDAPLPLGFLLYLETARRDGVTALHRAVRAMINTASVAGIGEQFTWWTVGQIRELSFTVCFFMETCAGTKLEHSRKNVVSLTTKVIWKGQSYYYGCVLQFQHHPTPDYFNYRMCFQLAAVPRLFAYFRSYHSI